jgi:RNA polymerase sigma-70 factor, ECF subfamily
MTAIEPSELGRWFDAYGNRLTLYARQWLSGDSAQDVVQDVFVRLMSRPRAPQNVRPWLFRSVRNAAVGRLRLRRRRLARQARVGLERPQWFRESPTALADPDEVQSTLVALPAEQREVIVLRIWCDMPFKEIAGIVDAPLSTVFSRYKAGLSTVKTRMELSCKTDPT